MKGNTIINDHYHYLAMVAPLSIKITAAAATPPFLSPSKDATAAATAAATCLKLFFALGRRVSGVGGGGGSGEIGHRLLVSPGEISLI